jgi:hypothetical protein
MIEERFIEQYGVRVSTSSEAYKEACEARVLLRMPIEKRRSMIDSFVKKRGRGHPQTEYLVREALQNALTREWEFRRAQKTPATTMETA